MMMRGGGEGFVTGMVTGAIIGAAIVLMASPSVRHEMADNMGGRWNNMMRRGRNMAENVADDVMEQMQ